VPEKFSQLRDSKGKNLPCKIFSFPLHKNGYANSMLVSNNRKKLSESMSENFKQKKKKFSVAENENFFQKK